jgi:phosphoglycerate dehydrogenase-like enzyme
MRILAMYGLFAPSASHLSRLRGAGDVVAVADSEEAAIAAAADAEIILGHRYLRQCLPFARRLRWVQSTAGGVAHLPLAELRAGSVRLSRDAISGPAIARHALTLAWALQRGLPAAFAAQAEGRWAPPAAWAPVPREAVVFGVGEIGRAIAGLLRRDGLRVTGVRRARSAGAPPEFDAVVGADEGEAALARADWCFLALPATAATRGWFDARRLALLPAHACLVNVGRGGCVVTGDLCRLLAAGHLAGAALDVMEPKPAGPDDPVWRTPRLLVTPHVASHRAERVEEMERLVEAQLERLRGGLDPLHLVDLDALIAEGGA